MDVPELCGVHVYIPELSCIEVSLSCVGVHMDVPELCGGSHGCP